MRCTLSVSALFFPSLLLGGCQLEKTGAPGSTTNFTPWEDLDLDGYVAGDDCDDADYDSNPAAEERCDGADNDCDGVVDDDPTDGVVVYPDGDADGYGATDGAQSVRCPDDIADFSETADDCDDGDDRVYPDAEDLCNDGLDADCDGEGCRYEGGYSFDRTDLVAYKITSDETDYTATSALILPDITGDGVAELLLGCAYAQYTEDIYDNTGMSFLMAGPITSDLLTRKDSYSSFYAPYSDMYSGRSLAVIQDSDGDDVVEVAIGPATSKGKIFLFEGSPTASSVPSGTATSYVYTSRPMYLGYSLSGGGDMTGDGDADLLIGAPGYVDGSTASGAAVVLQDPLISPDVSTGYLLYGESGDNAGLAVLAMDLDGDSSADAIVGSPYASDGGAVSWIQGPIGGEVGISDFVLIKGDETGCKAGAALANTGDVNGDGYEDLLVGGPECPGRGTKGGTVWLVFGQVEPAADGEADASFLGQSGDQAGTAMAGVGDMDGDGYGELAIGEPYRTTLVEKEGAVAMMYGRTGLTGAYELGSADVTFLGDAVGGTAGMALAGGLDLTGDGLPDLVVSAPGADSASGVVYVIPGLRF